MRYHDLDDHFRQVERTLDVCAPMSQYIIARLDGRGFSKLTNETLNFEKPFDDAFHHTMRSVCEHLMQSGFHLTICYTQSDEISVLFKSDDTSFNRKTRKLNSVLAGEASAVFSIAHNHPVSFDCRIIPLETLNEVADYFLWRSEDGHRNSLNAFCYWALRKDGETARCASDRLDSFDTHAKLELLNRYDVDFSAQEAWKRYGSLLHWQTVPHSGENPLTGKVTQTTRRKLNWVEQLPRGEQLNQLVTELAI